jgi:hypothetical protein
MPRAADRRAGAGFGDTTPDDDEVQITHRRHRGDHRRKRARTPAERPYRHRIPSRHRVGLLPGARIGQDRVQ